MLKTSWVRNSVVRRSAAGSASPVASSTEARSSAAGAGRDPERPSTASASPRRDLGRAQPDVVVVDEAHVHAGWRAAATTSAARPGTTARTVSKNSSGTTSTPPSRSACASAAAWRCTRVAIAGARPGRGRRRTSRRPRRAAPARCRCWRSPGRDGCAAHGSAARAGTPDGRPRRPRPRPAVRAGAARARRAPT